MKVICIDNDFVRPDGSDHGIPALTICQVYTVAELIDYNGIVLYVLAEIAPVNNEIFEYDACCFIRIDGPCEVALLEERVDQEIAALDKSFREFIHEVENACA